MRKLTLFGSIGLIVAVGVIAVVGWGNSKGGQSQTVKPESDQVARASGTVVVAGQSEFGTMLFDNHKQAIYIWELEESPKAECYGDCAVAWPPVLTDGAPRAGTGVQDSLLGTTVRSDGSTQVTYNGHPLYYYAHEGPGEVKCHNILTHGGYWWVITPSGVRAA